MHDLLLSYAGDRVGVRMLSGKTLENVVLVNFDDEAIVIRSPQDNGRRLIIPMANIEAIVIYEPEAEAV